MTQLVYMVEISHSSQRFNVIYLLYPKVNLVLVTFIVSFFFFFKGEKEKINHSISCRFKYGS
jgi:hypothetical protein